MEIDKIICPETNDISYRFTAKCGMEVHYIPSSFITTCAVLGVRCGAFDTQIEDAQGILNIVPGSAHFLEHKMYDMQDGSDAFDLFAACGASANAFTTHEYTAYMFSSTDANDHALESLLYFVFHPHFDQNAVEREKGIIEQEIASYGDDASYRSYMTALSMMYGVHPIRYDIAGSKKSIENISAEYLNRIYRHFYRPEKMVLTICGQIDLTSVEQLIDHICGVEPPICLCNRRLPAYDTQEAEHERMLKMDIAEPHVVIAYKNRALEQCNPEKQGYLLDIGAAALFGRTSELFYLLFEQGLVSRDFEGYYEWSWGVGHMVLSFDTSYSEKVIKIITDYMEHIEEHLPSYDKFISMRSVAYADVVTVFDHVSDIALSDLEETMCGGDYYTLPGIINQLTYQEFCQYIISFFKDNRPFIVVVNTNKNTEDLL